MRARQKQKLHAKAGRPCAALNFFRIHIFDEIVITQTVKLMELIKMMVKMMKMMEMSRQFNNLNVLKNLTPELFKLSNCRPQPPQGTPIGFIWKLALVYILGIQSMISCL